MCVCDIVFLMNLRMVVFQNTVLRLTAPAFKLNSLSPLPHSAFNTGWMRRSPHNNTSPAQPRVW